MFRHRLLLIEGLIWELDATGIYHIYTGKFGQKSEEIYEMKPALLMINENIYLGKLQEEGRHLYLR